MIHSCTHPDQLRPLKYCYMMLYGTAESADTVNMDKGTKNDLAFLTIFS